ncbi:PAS sensor-containing signal-transduction protein [Campylobacter subantarcticus LMG 24377]|uniref:PAS sensor-containing signal-transduction protein n=2 Tax=Campylobacter subantarcticus TaxID=497724 RepID=A0A0A8HDI8_9BACT|nr:PAS sensor protein [Campylobacter subantarcticus]EAJ1260446.1 PAS sensor protein [Campylobacter lari]AJC90964.1 PAS sensor-containing signal-transduction protein [Campylobacter subantarcticus LMG 24374]AJC92742.1 PAS sensor-containing signal-transduction protein [Campylobacter subantarcticus LMG 24377]EAL3938164.1 PAS sensor protein [Campylobacter lari]MPB99091.1 PAS sensor protein [Campylobacter subantarcticus]
MSSEKNLTSDVLITSKTNLKGEIVYANEDFLNYSDYKIDEILYKPHSIMRHPDMPRTVFKYLWDNIQLKKEIFAFVKNKTKFNDYYWVFANITASCDANGNTLNYYSVRRKPKAEAVKTIEGIYKVLIRKENESGIKAGLEELNTIVKSYGMSYNELIMQIQK